MKASKSYHESLIKALKDPVEAAGYLNAVLNEGDMKMFLKALRNVAEAHGGMVHLSKHTKLNRANLYQIFSRKGNPGIHTMEHVLKSFGLRLSVIPDQTNRLKKAA